MRIEVDEDLAVEHIERIAPRSACPKPEGTIYDSTRSAAEYLANTWFERSHTLLSGAPHHSTYSVLKELGQLSNKDRCIFLFQYVPGKGIRHERPTQHCSDNAGLLARLYLYRTWLHRAMEGEKQGSVPRPSAAFTHPFYFYIDITDGHRSSSALSQALGAPILVQSKWSGDNYSIPIPDAHMVSGHLLYTADEIDYSVEGLARTMFHIYGADFGKDFEPWRERMDALAYRGCCNPTLDSRTADPDVYVFPRADLCRYKRQSATPEAYDVSTSLCGLADLCGQLKGQATPFSRFCEHCGSCPAPHPSEASLTKTQMAGYRYIADVDGYGASYDGKYWKLRSGSTVFSILAEDEATGGPLELHQQWYFPLLKHGQHYFQTTAKELDDKLQWCRQHDQACEKVGAAGRQLAQCIVTPEMASGYTYLVMKRIHDLAVAAAAAAEGQAAA